MYFPEYHKVVQGQGLTFLGPSYKPEAVRAKNKPENPHQDIQHLLSPPPWSLKLTKPQYLTHLNRENG